MKNRRKDSCVLYNASMCEQCFQLPRAALRLFRYTSICTYILRRCGASVGMLFNYSLLTVVLSKISLIFSIIWPKHVIINMFL
jgi:hypothetical protein